MLSEKNLYPNQNSIITNILIEYEAANGYG